MVHAWCVHMAVRTTNESCEVRPTRKSPTDACTSAAPPTAASGELESIVTATPPLAVVPFTTGSAGAFVGEVGLLHAPASVPNALPATSAAARTQKLRRVFFVSCT